VEEEEQSQDLLQSLEGTAVRLGPITVVPEKEKEKEKERGIEQ